MPQVVPPHSGPFVTSTHPQPVSIDAPFVNTSYGRHVRPSAQVPSQMGCPVPPVHGVGGGNPARHASTSAVTSAAVPVQDPRASAFAIAAPNFSSTFRTQAASTAVPGRVALLAQTFLPAAFRPAARSFRTAQDGTPSIARSNAATHAVTVTPGSSPGHGPVLFALANRLASFFSTFRRHVASSSPPALRASA